MKTVEYALGSLPRRSIPLRVPSGYDEQARKLISLTGKGPFEDRKKTVSMHPLLNDSVVFSDFLSLALCGPDSGESERLQDRIYVRACMLEHEKKGRGDLGVGDFMRIETILSTAFEELGGNCQIE